MRNRDDGFWFWFTVGCMLVLWMGALGLAVGILFIKWAAAF